MRPTDLLPKRMIEELLRLHKLDPEWVELMPFGEREYRAIPRQPTWLMKQCVNGGDLFGLLATSRWLGEGPKVFRPTDAQCAALEQVEINLTLADYSQPYPALLIELPKGRYGPFTSVICFLHRAPYLLCGLNSVGHEYDIVTTVARAGSLIESSVNWFDEECKELAAAAAPALRVALNSCLALVNFGCRLGYLFPKEVEDDRRLGMENTDRGRRARDRLPLAVQLVSFDREVALHRTEGSRELSEPTGKQMPPHWRRGHWRSQPYGTGRSERKRVLIPPVLVRKDLFVGKVSDTTTQYRG